MSSSSLHCFYFIVMSWEISKELLSKILHISLHTKLLNIIVSFKIICVDKSSIHTPDIPDILSHKKVRYRFANCVRFHWFINKFCFLCSQNANNSSSRLIFISSIQVGALYHDVFFAGAARAYVSTLTRLRNTTDSWSQNSGIAWKS